MRQRILYCSNFYPPNFLGGAELTAHSHALTLRELGHEVAVFAGNKCGRGARHDLVNEQWSGLQIWRLTLTDEDFGGGESSFYKAAIDERFAAVLNDFKPNVVHFHNLIGLSLGMVTRAKNHGSKVFCTVHDHWGFCFKNTLLRPTGQVCSDSTRCARCQPQISAANGALLPMRLRRDYVLHQMRQVDGFVSPSYYLAGTYRRAGISTSAFSVIPYGIDIEKFNRRQKTPSNGQLRVGFVGYLGQHKGADVLIDAVEKASLRDRLHVSIAGEGESRAYLERMAKERHLGSHIRFLGKLDNRCVRVLHESLDVLVVPSVWPENSPVTIYEGQAAGTVVIASRAGGVPELIEHGSTGLLFEPGSSDELAMLLDRLAASPTLVERIGRRAAESIAPLTLESAARRLEQLYASPTEVDAARQNQDGRVLIAVAGALDSNCLQALERADLSPRFESLCFLNMQWADPESARHADVVWIADRSYCREDLYALGLHGKPLIVPGTWVGTASDRIVGRYSESSGVRAILGRLIHEWPSMLQALRPMTA